MAYNKTVWKNGQTKLNADNLNHIEDGISKVSINVDNLSNQFKNISTIYETKTDATDKLNTAKLDATTKSNKALQDSKAYTDSKKTDAVNESKAYTDELSTTVSTTYETKADAVSKAASALDSSKEYTDIEIAKIKLNTNQLNAVNSGITQAKVNKYDSYEELINSKPNMSNVYTKIEVNDTFETKTDATSKLNKAKDHTTTEVSNLKKYTDEQFKKINDNLITTVDCSHKYEITGNTGDEHGLAIDDQQMLIKKIQGHSRRKSLNLIKIDKSNFILEENTYKQTFKLKHNTNYTVSTNLEREETGQTKVWFNGTSTVSDGVWNGNDRTKVSNANGELYLLIDKNSFSQLENKTFWIMLNEGTTALPFQPYDNTLVNSNNTLISTGRNLVDVTIPKLNDSSFVTFMENITLPKGKYDFLFTSDTKGNDTFNISIDDLLLSGNAVFNKRGSFTLDKTMTGALTGWNNVAQTNVKLCIWYGWDEKHTSFEPYKQDIIQAPSLGEFDYYQESKIYRRTSQVVTLNGSESWIKQEVNGRIRYYIDITNKLPLAIFNDDGFNVVTNVLPTSTVNTIYDTQKAIAMSDEFIFINIVGITTVDQLKQWLSQNPIQLVYKLATPTIEDYTMPSGMAVYNGGLQIQQGDGLPYTITKQYNLSQKAQILANIEVDREQQKQIDENNQKFNLIPKFSHVDINQPSTATNGTLTQGQLVTLQESDLNYIIFNNEIYSLNDKTHTADTLTYSHVGFENGKHLLKTISITVSTRAWVLNTTIVSQGGAPAPTDELLGTWVFNDNIPVSSSVSIFNITFISDSTTYKSIIYGGNTGIDFSTSVPSGSFVPVSGNAYSTTWVKEAYKTIEITNVDNLSDKSSFLAWLKSNATKQGNGGSGGGTTGKEFGYTLKTNSYFPNSFLVFGGETTFNNKQNEPENWYGWHDIKTGGGTTKNALMFIMIRNYSNAVDNGNIYDANGTIVKNSSIDPLRVNVLYLLGSDATIWSRD